MKKLTFSPIIALVVLAAIFPTYAVELVKAETIDKTSLVADAKHAIKIQFDQADIEVSAKETQLKEKAAIYAAAEKNKLDVQKSIRLAE